MIVKQAIYLTEDRKQAVARGDAAARFLFASAGDDIPDAKLDSVEGARELAEGSKAVDERIEAEDEPKKAAKKAAK
jgi:hypothetical protein